jgi:hypothetical protein
MSSQPFRLRKTPAQRISEAGDVQIGELVSVDSDGRPLVTFDGGPPHGVVARVATAEPAPAEIDANNLPKVLLTFEGADVVEPIIVGFVRDSFTRRSASQTVVVAVEDTRRIELNGKAVIFRAEEEIVLKCGLGSLTIRADGQIVIKGRRLVSRASESNKIRGASVEIN